MLFRLGNIVIIGEAKSIVATDSPISCFRSYKTLEKATEQVKRKSNFIKENINEICNRLGWPLSDTEYSFVPIVLTSNNFYVGFSINDVPIVDNKIFTKYFDDNEVPIISVLDGNNYKNLAWYIIYKSQEEAEKNIKKYLFNPPQIVDTAESLKQSTIRVPYIKEESNKILITRLIAKDFKIEDKLKEEHIFPLEKSDELDELLKGNFFTM